MHQKSRCDEQLFLRHVPWRKKTLMGGSSFFCSVPISMISAVIFDLDGTLVDTAGEIALALNATLAQLHLPELPRRDVETLIGRGVRSLVERAVAQAGGAAIDLDAAVERFEEQYGRTVGTQARLFPGVSEGLRLFHASGFPLGVVTNKPRYFTERLLAGLAVDSLFSAVITGDDGIRRKPYGDMLLAACRVMGTKIEAALMVGDSDNDVLAARAAGCPVWCVPYGYNEGRSAATLQCDRMVATVEEAARLLLATRAR
jgi:phosphoglycolate phosphatase